MVAAVGKDTRLAMVLPVGLAAAAVLALSRRVHLEERAILLPQAPAKGTAGLVEQARMLLVLVVEPVQQQQE